jgi:hypothetical protein
MKLGEALRFALARPVPLFAMITIIAGQMMMTNVMVMTPVHMDHQEFSLGAIGIVVSIHIAGMYALSPVFGWMADRWGSGVVIAGGRRYLRSHDRPRRHRCPGPGVVDGAAVDRTVAARNRVVDVPHRRLVPADRLGAGACEGAAAGRVGFGDEPRWGAHGGDGRSRARRRRVPLDQPHGHVRPAHRRRVLDSGDPDDELAGTRSHPPSPRRPTSPLPPRDRTGQGNEHEDGSSRTARNR